MLVSFAILLSFKRLRLPWCSGRGLEMKPRTSWEQIYEDMQREDARQDAAYKAYSVRRTKPPMSKFWTLVGSDRITGDEFRRLLSVGEKALTCLNI